MSKKSRKKSTRASSTSRVAVSKAPVADRPLVKAATKKMPAAVTHYLSSEELDKRYQYVKDDLKLIAIIAIPMILGLIIAGIFVKI